MKKPNTLSLAKEYVRAGFSVIPLKPRNKIPALPWREFQERLPTEQELTSWFGKDSPNNIGIVSGTISGLAALDADSAEAVEWCEANLPKTPTVQTARGRHYYFRFRNGLRNSVKVNGLKLDVRGEGGYVAAPPSEHETGAVYHWVEGRGLGDLSLAEFPPELLARNNDKPATAKEATNTGKYRAASPLAPRPYRFLPEDGTDKKAPNTLGFYIKPWIQGCFLLASPPGFEPGLPP